MSEIKPCGKEKPKHKKVSEAKLRKTYAVKPICTCICHEIPNVKHCVACCSLCGKIYIEKGKINMKKYEEHLYEGAK